MPNMHTVMVSGVLRIVVDKDELQDIAGIDFVDEQGRLRTRVEVLTISTGDNVTVSDPDNRVPPTSPAEGHMLGVRSDLGEGRTALAIMPGPGRSPYWRGYRYVDRPATDDQMMLEVLNNAYRMRNHAGFSCFGGTQVFQERIGANESSAFVIEHGTMSNLARFKAELGIRRSSDQNLEFFTVRGGGRVDDNQIAQSVTSDGVVGGPVGLSASHFVVARVNQTLTLTINNPLPASITVGGCVTFGGC